MKKKGEVYYTFGIMMITLMLMFFTFSALVDKTQKSFMLQGDVIQEHFYSTYMNAELDSLKYETSAKYIANQAIIKVKDYSLCEILSDGSYEFNSEKKTLKECKVNYTNAFSLEFEKIINKSTLFNHTYKYSKKSVTGISNNLTKHPIKIIFVNKVNKEKFENKMNLQISKELKIPTKENEFLLGLYEFKPDFTIEVPVLNMFEGIQKSSENIYKCTSKDCIDKEIKKISKYNISSEYHKDIDQICKLDIDKTDKVVKFCLVLPRLTYIKHGMLKQERQIFKYAVFVPNLES